MIEYLKDLLTGNLVSKREVDTLIKNMNNFIDKYGRLHDRGHRVVNAGDTALSFEERLRMDVDFLMKQVGTVDYNDYNLDVVRKLREEVEKLKEEISNLETETVRILKLRNN